MTNETDRGNTMSDKIFLPEHFTLANADQLNGTGQIVNDDDHFSACGVVRGIGSL